MLPLCLNLLGQACHVNNNNTTNKSGGGGKQVKSVTDHRLREMPEARKTVASCSLFSNPICTPQTGISDWSPNKGIRLFNKLSGRCTIPVRQGTHHFIPLPRSLGKGAGSSIKHYQVDFSFSLGKKDGLRKKRKIDINS